MKYSKKCSGSSKKGKHYIDWDDIAKGIERRYKQKFKSEAEALKYVYDRSTSVVEAAEKIGVSHTTLGPRLRLLGIPPKGRGVKGSLVDRMKKADLSGKTAREIAEMFDANFGTVKMVLSKHKMEFRKVRSW